MSTTIFTALGPNYQRDDILLSLRLLLQPWKWRSGLASRQLEQAFAQTFDAELAVSFTTGRGSLWALLAACNNQPGDEVALQAYTCVAVVEPILWHGARPVYIDVDRRSGNMSPASLEQRITSRTKVLIIQHTFGLPADLDELLSIAQKHNLIVIEDCAHAIGARYHNKLVGTFGQAAFFSFGRDKVMSSVFGGVAIAHDHAIAERLRIVHESVSLPPRSWIVQQLVHPCIIALVKQTYDVLSIGKVILKIAQECRLISKSVYPIERSGGRPLFATKKMPAALALLALKQIKKLDSYNYHRQTISKEYSQILSSPAVEEENGIPETYLDREHIFLRFLLVTDNSQAVFHRARHAGVILGDWYTTVIAPSDVDLHAIGYRQGSCPNAEWLAEHSINLPTHIGIDAQTARRIASLVVQS